MKRFLISLATLGLARRHLAGKSHMAMSRPPDSKGSLRALLGVLLLATPAAVQAQFTYTTNAGAITITGYTGAGGNVAIPTNINGLPVTGIGEQAFFEISTLTSVSIPGSVTNIGNEAFFYCYRLTNVTIPGSVTSIGEEAFSYCSMASVTIPNSVTSIGESAFDQCNSLTAITVDAQDSFYSSVNGVLFDKSQTTLIQYPGGLGGSYTIPGSVTSIGEFAFFYSQDLTDVTIPNSVTNIGNSAFATCFRLTAIMVDAQDSFYSSLNGVLFDKSQTTLIQCPGGLGGSYMIPGSVTDIGTNAFEYCTSLTSVTIPNSVTNIGDDAFGGCTSLTNVTIPDSVTSFGENAFGECFSLTSVTIPSSVTNIGDFAFSDCTTLAGVYFMGNAPTADATVFEDDTNATAYYLSGATGWSSTFAGIPAVLVPTIVIKTEVLPATAGAIVNGAGSYGKGSKATVTASTANECYEFTAWNAGGKKVSTNNPYTFTVTNNETLTANFTQLEYTISTSSSPANGGTTSGGGKKACGTTATLTAHAKPGFAFVDWTVAGEPTVTIPSATCKIPVSDNASFTANFKDIKPPTVKITSPGANEKIPTAAFPIQGTASDNVGVEAVYYNLNGTGWIIASTTDGFTNWYAWITLKPDSANTVSAYAVDTLGNKSTNGPTKFLCTAAGLAPLSIAGQLGVMEERNNPDASVDVSFDSAVYVRMSASTNDGGDVGTYTYTPTGPDTAELAPHSVLPVQDTGTNGTVMELTFTDAYNAVFTDNAGGKGTINFVAVENSVPTTLDGAVVTASSAVESTFFSTNTFGKSTFTNTDSLGGDSSGTYTFTQFTPLAALVVETAISPPSAVGTTNYIVLTFTNEGSLASGVYFFNGLSATNSESSDSGTFVLNPGTDDTEFLGPVSLSGLQAAITPTGEPSFTRSYGNGTFASISLASSNEPTDVGIILANTRVSADTGFDQLIALAPPYAVGLDDDTIDVTFTSATKAAFVVEGSPGQTGTVTYSKLATNAPPALTGHTITAIPTVKAKKQATSVITFTNQYLTVKSSKVSAGTYTYAPYTPTMALVQADFTSGDGAGETAYVFLDFVSTVAGSYVLAEPDTASPGGWRYEPGKFTFSTTK